VDLGRTTNHAGSAASTRPGGLNAPGPSAVAPAGASRGHKKPAPANPGSPAKTTRTVPLRSGRGEYSRSRGQ
jgi:hypothetical protein